MSKVVKKKITKEETYQALKALYYSGKVKPSLNKILAELENDSENLELSLLACQCLARAKSFDELFSLAETLIKLNPENADGYYYKGVAIKHIKGKEQEALKNFNHALTLDSDNTIYLKSKATTHVLLYKDYDLPVQFADKHRVKANESLAKIIALIEKKENPDYIDYLTIADASMLDSKNQDGKKYYIKAVSAFNNTDSLDQDMNIYKDIIRSQNACIKLINKFTE